MKEKFFIFMTVDRGAIEKETDMLSWFVNEMQSRFENRSTNLS